jgi:copper(I)-binding protein
MHLRSLPVVAALGVLLSVAGALPSLAATGDVTVSNAWARASAGAATTGAAYVTLKGGAHDDRLVGVSAPVADTVQVHESTNESGVSRMRQVIGGLAIPAGKTVSLQPGGYHIMMMGLHQPLVAEKSFPLTLTFAHTAPVTVSVQVKPIGAAAGHDHMDSMQGMSGSMGNMPMGKSQ